MTHRERFGTVLHGRLPDRVPMVARLDIWYAARRSEGTLPPQVIGISIEQIEEKLRMGRSARLGGFCAEAREGAEDRIEHDGDRTIHTLEIAGRSVREVTLSSPDLRRRGMLAHRQEHFLKTAGDYDTMIRIWERTRFIADHAACRRFDGETGDAGYPMLLLPLIPAHRIMLEYAGYENFYLHRADFPDVVAELRRVMESVYERFWDEVAACDIDLILHGAHWNSQMTPPPIFEEMFLPYLRRFTDAMHAAGKTCAFHADADLSGLVDLVKATGIDVADCFACAPLVPLTLADARRAWGDRVVVWGGFPATLLEPSAADREFRTYLDAFITEISNGRAVIVGVSDNVMPGAIWERMVELARRVALLRPGGVDLERPGQM